MSEENLIYAGIIIAVIVFIVLIFQRWFWLLVFFFPGLASFFAMCASVIHFQILAALGFFVLMVICVFFYFRLDDIAEWIAERIIEEFSGWWYILIVAAIILYVIFMNDPSSQP